VGEFIINDLRNVSYRFQDRLVTFHIEDDKIHFEDGPEYEGARRHEAMGGSQNLSEFKSNPYPWIYDYPGLHQLICLHLDKLGL